MNIAAEKKELIRQFNEVHDLAIIQAVKNLLNNKAPQPTAHAEEVHIQLSYSPEQIVAGNKTYILNYPLRCLFEKMDDHFVIKNETLDIYAAGKTEAETINDFSDEFDNLYSTLNRLTEQQLTTRMSNIKKFINLYINQIV